MKEKQPPNGSNSPIVWAPKKEHPKFLRGYLPKMEDITLFHIEEDPKNPKRGTLTGACIPDDENGRAQNRDATIPVLKNRAWQYLTTWDERRGA